MSRWQPPQPKAPSPRPTTPRPALQRKAKPTTPSDPQSTPHALPRWLSSAVDANVQQKAARRDASQAPLDPDQIHQIAEAGVQGTGAPLPHLADIQAALHPHDLSDVRAFIGGPAQQAADALGAIAYTTGNRIAFASPPSLHTAAHEATHIVQQRVGVKLPEGVGQTGDVYEQEAETAAEFVARDSFNSSSTFHDTIRKNSPQNSLFPQIIDSASSSIQLKKQNNNDNFHDGNNGSLTLVNSELGAAIDIFRLESIGLLEHTFDWLEINWKEYLGATGGNSSLGWTESHTYGIISNALGNVLTDPSIGASIKKKAQHNIANYLGSAGIFALRAITKSNLVTFVLGVLVEYAASTIFDYISRKKSVDEIIADVSEKQTDIIHEKYVELNQARKNAACTLESQLASLKKSTEDLHDLQSLVDRVNWAILTLQEEKQNQWVSDLSLSHSMLHDWVLQHAATPHKQNKSTSEEQWRRAKERITTGKKKSPTQIPTLFVHQLRGHWSELGIYPTRLRGRGESRNIDDIEQDIADILYTGSPRDESQTIYDIYNGSVFYFDFTTRPEYFVEFMKNRTARCGNRLSKEERESAIRALKNKKGLDSCYCYIKLDYGDGACSVVNLVYVIKFQQESNIHTFSPNDEFIYDYYI